MEGLIWGEEGVGVKGDEIVVVMVLLVGGEDIGENRVRGEREGGRIKLVKEEYMVGGGRMLGGEGGGLIMREGVLMNEEEGELEREGGGGGLEESRFRL